MTGIAMTHVPYKGLARRASTMWSPVTCR
jgi:hypothetical protein